MTQKQSSNEKQAVLQMACSMLIFGTIGIFRRFIPLSSALLACVRGLGGALFLYLYVKAGGRKADPASSGKAKLLFVFTGCLIGLNWMFLFEAYRYTSVGIATLCYYMQPVIVLLLSPLLFQEKLTLHKILCVLAAMLGMALISGIHPQGNDLRGILLGLAAACLYAGVVILNKKAPAGDAYEKTTIQLFSAGLILVPYLLLTEGFSFAGMTPAAWILLAAVCLIHTGIAYLLYFNSIRAVPAQTIAVMGYIDPVFALFLSVLILQEPLTASALTGAVLIIGGALMAELIGSR